jgi:hypothetical protein
MTHRQLTPSPNVNRIPEEWLDDLRVGFSGDPLAESLRTVVLRAHDAPSGPLVSAYAVGYQSGPLSERDAKFACAYGEAFVREWVHPVSWSRLAKHPVRSGMDAVEIIVRQFRASAQERGLQLREFRGAHDAR